MKLQQKNRQQINRQLQQEKQNIVQQKDQRYVLRWVVRLEEESSLKHFLCQHRGMSRRMIRKIKEGGAVLLNENVVTVRQEVRTGDVVEVIFPFKAEGRPVTAEEMPLQILYEDKHLLILNKPAGICVHPTISQSSGTLANGVMAHWQRKGKRCTFHAVNRLDRDTSGIVVVTTNPFTHHQLSLQQASGQLKRRYDVWVEGVVKEDEGTINAPIGPHPDSKIERMVRADGKPAVTHFHVQQRFAEHTWLKVRLETGRTHQIRLHMMEMGHPLIGDTLYAQASDKISRQALHASWTRFIHPHEQRELEIEAPLPDDLRKLIYHV